MARLALPGIPMHVVQRGNNRQPCFFHTSDYQFYLETAFACAQRYQVAVHAYVQMTNRDSSARDRAGAYLALEYG